MDKIGNNAAMREALVIAKKAICHHTEHICQSLSWENSTINANCADILCAHRDLCEAKTAIQKALAEPPRNCDRFDDADAAISAFRREMRPGNPDIDLYHVIDWLLAEGEAEAKPGRKTAFNPEAYYERMLQDPDVRRVFYERHGYGLSGKDERDGTE